MELHELMINTYTGKGPAQVAIKQNATRHKRERNYLSYDPWPDQSVDVTANKHVTMITPKISKSDLLSMDYITRDTFYEQIYLSLLASCSPYVFEA